MSKKIALFKQPDRQRIEDFVAGGTANASVAQPAVSPPMEPPPPPEIARVEPIEPVAQSTAGLTSATAQKSPAPIIDDRAKEPKARLTIDLPVELHTRFKIACVTNRTKMVEEVVQFIEIWTHKHS